MPESENNIQKKAASVSKDSRNKKEPASLAGKNALYVPADFGNRLFRVAFLLLVPRFDGFVGRKLLPVDHG